MQAVLQTKPNKPLKYALEWCLLASIVLHLAFVLSVAKPDYDLAAPVSQEIKIELSKPEPPKDEQPKPEPTPQPPKPEPKKEPPKIEPKAQPVKPMPQKSEPMPQPVAPPQPTQVVETHTQPVIAAKPAVTESKPEALAPITPAPSPPAPVSEPVKISGPSDSDIDAARNAFRSAAHRELKKNQRYPRIAADRGIEGEVKLNIHLDESGNIASVDVAESSGNNALDEAAVNAAKKSNLKSYFHEILRGRVDSIIVTVSFKLAN